MKKIFATILLLSLIVIQVKSQEKVFPGADENTPSRAQYFSWINNTNEGADEEHTRINLDFFGWLKSEYGMQLDIYAFDAVCGPLRPEKEDAFIKMMQDCRKYSPDLILQAFNRSLILSPEIYGNP